ncbi:MAG: hypothetical protein K2Y23_02830 [Cyanobacteria bacterium]|nr:hypothetical protein [Cyanobacteriota bacterium]
MTPGDSRFGVAVSLDPGPVIELYKKDVDRTLIRENLKLTPDGRLRELQALINSLQGLREAPRRTP